MTTYKVGIVGYGYMGEIRKRIVDASDRMELVGVSDPNPEVQEKLKNTCVIYDSVDELISKVDIVFVCTPNCYSPAICIKSMDQGKHVFCEKPPGRNTEDIKDIMKAEQGNRVKLMFGFNHRFHPGVIRAKVIADNLRLGKIVGMRGIYGKSGGVRFRESWRNDREVSGGGILLDQGIHMLDLFHYFCGDFDEAKCFVGNAFWGFDVEDNAYVILRNKKQQLAL